MIIYIDRLFLYAMLSTYCAMRFADGMSGGRRRCRRDLVASILGAVLFVWCFCAVVNKHAKECGGQNALWGLLLGSYIVLYSCYCCLTARKMLRYRTCLERVIWVGKNVCWFLCGNALLGCLMSGMQLLMPVLGENYLGGCLSLCLAGGCVKNIPRWVKSRRRYRRCMVYISHDKMKLQVHGFVDTGNLLRGPQGERVCVLRDEVYEELRSLSEMEEGCIAYFGANGVVATMPSMKVERLEILSEQERMEQNYNQRQAIQIQTDVTVAKGGRAFCKGYDMLLPEWE